MGTCSMGTFWNLQSVEWWSDAKDGHQVTDQTASSWLLCIKQTWWFNVHKVKDRQWILYDGCLITIVTFMCCYMSLTPNVNTHLSSISSCKSTNLCRAFSFARRNSLINFLSYSFINFKTFSGDLSSLLWYLISGILSLSPSPSILNPV